MASTPLVFREATPADIDVLLLMIRTAYRGTQGWTTESSYLNDKRISAEGLLEKINNPHGVVLVATHAEMDDVIIACCEVELQEAGAGAPTAYFGLFAVDISVQAGGIGRRVLARAEEYAREKWAVQRMEMWVIWLRAELIDYYLRRGYRRTEEVKPFPYEHIFEGKALRDDLYFDVLRKDLSLR